MSLIDVQDPERNPPLGVTSRIGCSPSHANRSSAVARSGRSSVTLAMLPLMLIDGPVSAIDLSAWGGLRRYPSNRGSSPWIMDRDVANPSRAEEDGDDAVRFSGTLLA